MSLLDLDAYLERIGVSRPEAPALDLLRELHYAHTAAIPFENLDFLLRRPLPLDVASLERKLVHEGRGGCCFEHNLLFGAALRALGFEVTDLAARVLWNAPADAVGPRSHMLLRVEVEGTSWIADAGFGGQTLTGPLRLEPQREQATPHGRFRLVEQGRELRLEVRLVDEWRPLYRFDLTPQERVDFEVSGWYLATHPSSHFLRDLLVARPGADRRWALSNTSFSVHHLDGTRERHEVARAAELRHLLEDVFGLRWPADDEAGRLLERIVAQGPAPA